MTHITTTTSYGVMLPSVVSSTSYSASSSSLPFGGIVGGAKTSLPSTISSLNAFGGIVGGVAGIIVLALLVSIVVFCVLRSRKHQPNNEGARLQQSELQQPQQQRHYEYDKIVLPQECELVQKRWCLLLLTTCTAQTAKHHLQSMVARCMVRQRWLTAAATATIAKEGTLSSVYTTTFCHSSHTCSKHLSSTATCAYSFQCQNAPQRMCML
jgi:hypothetical protein